MLQAFPLNGKIVCRAITAEEEAEDTPPAHRGKSGSTGRNVPPFNRR